MTIVKWLGGIIVALMFLVALFANQLSPHVPTAIDVKNILVGPNLSHPFGTDDLGRDVLSRMIYGARISLLVGFVSVGDRGGEEVFPRGDVRRVVGSELD